MNNQDWPLPIFEDVDLCRRLRRQARPILLDGARLRVSARRWKTEGVLRATLRNRILLLAYRAGVDPERLLDFYPPHRKVFP